MTVKVTVVLLVAPPPEAVMVKVKVPIGCEDGVVMVSVDVKGGVPDAGANEAVVPVGNPETLSEMVGMPTVKLVVKGTLSV